MFKWKNKKNKKEEYYTFSIKYTKDSAEHVLRITRILDRLKESSIDYSDWITKGVFEWNIKVPLEDKIILNKIYFNEYGSWTRW